MYDDLTPTQRTLYDMYKISDREIRAPTERQMKRDWPKRVEYPTDEDMAIVGRATMHAFLKRAVRNIPPPATPSVSRPAPPSPVVECNRLGVPFTPHPTNPGITGMRAANALRAYYKEQASCVG